MGNSDEEIDFSSYLVDLGENDEETSGHPTNIESSDVYTFAGCGRAGGLQKPLRTHPAKNWSGALLTKSVVSVSPSPPETVSDKASTGSNSTASTAASSVVSTSYPGSTGLWTPEMGNSALSEQPGSAGRNGHAERQQQQQPAGTHGRSKSGSVSGGVPYPQTTATASFSAPRRNLSFSYDFAHDPSPNSFFSSTANTLHHSSTRSSAPLPGKDWLEDHGNSHKQPFSTPSGKDVGTPYKAAIHDVHAIPPSSGPASSSHRAKNALSSTTATTAAHSAIMGAPHWPTSSSAGASSSQPTALHPWKPYARPLHQESSSVNNAGISSINTTYGASPLQKRSSKRKTASISSSSNLALRLENKSHFGPVTPQPLSITPVGSYALPSPGYLYRESHSGMTSPVSPAVDGFPSFPASTHSASTAESPLPNFSTAATSPSDIILSAVTAPSPFDPRNFSNFQINPLATTDEQQESRKSGVGTPSTMPSARKAVDVNKAVALAGIGGKWFNWASQQPGETLPPTTSVLSSFCTDDAALFPSSTGSTGPKTAAATSFPTSKPSASGYQREASIASHNPSDWPDLNGQSPELMAANDPLATHLWRLYSKAKAGLPSGARMENITWRMMSLKLNKQKLANEKVTTEGDGATSAAPSVLSPTQLQQESRGRKGRSAPNSASPESRYVALETWTKSVLMLFGL